MHQLVGGEAVKYHVVTSFGRPGNFDRIYHMLEARGAASWILLINSDETPPPAAPGNMPVVVARFTRVGYLNNPVVLCNQWLSTSPVVREDRYVFLCDDDWLPEGFFEAVDKSEAPVVIVSMNRGQHDKFHPAWPLVAAPENLHYGYFGFEQGVVTGAALEDLRKEFAVNLSGHNEDVIFEMVKRFPTDYLPAVFVYFNALEAGRWDSVPGTI
jgi:hypothetical protein